MKKRIVSMLFWGFILWLTGYIAGFILFFIVPKEYIGWIITPLATLLTIWVLQNKVKQSKIVYYLGLGVLWVLLAMLLDYIFIVKLLDTGSTYYKPDVLIYYILTFALPLIAGYWNLSHKLSLTG